MFFVSLYNDSVSETDKNEDAADLYLAIPFLVTVWFYIAQAIKRCHDRGNIGLFLIVPFYYLWMLFGDGDPYENKYGPDPKLRDIAKEDTE